MIKFVYVLVRYLDQLKQTLPLCHKYVQRYADSNVPMYYAMIMQIVDSY
jgi:hypothetical protein